MNAVVAERRAVRGGVTPLRAPPHVQVDFVSHAPRRIPVSRSAHIRGYEPIGVGRPAVAFESKLEREVIRALAKFPQLRELRAQPITIHYQCNGSACRYTPDLLVVLDEVPACLESLGFARRTLVEVKPDSRLALDGERLERHVRAVQRACAEPWVLITDGDLAAHALEYRDERR